MFVPILQLISIEQNHVSSIKEKVFSFFITKRWFAAVRYRQIALLDMPFAPTNRLKSPRESAQVFLRQTNRRFCVADRRLRFGHTHRRANNSGADIQFKSCGEASQAQ
jgi:hypothetical protein